MTEDLRRSSTFYSVYTKQQDQTKPARIGIYTCERTTAASGDSLGPNLQNASLPNALPLRTPCFHGLDDSQELAAMWPSARLGSRSDLGPAATEKNHLGENVGTTLPYFSNIGEYET